MVEAFIVAWQESETIRLTLSHYNSFCEKVTLFDNYSTDGTPDIARELGAEVKQFGTPGVLSDDDYLTVKNNCWKKSKADWVIVCDADEIIWDREWDEGFPKLLEDATANGYTMFKTRGFDVVSHEMPEVSFLEITQGYVNENYSKSVIFNPREIKDINYKYGCHVCKPVGNINVHPQNLVLMHYRNIGGPQRLVDRHALYRPRMSEKNRRFGLGCHYEYTDEQRIKEWYEKYDASGTLFKAGVL
jgi:glycosyltransferase involved in cell wall biosynthesis